MLDQPAARIVMRCHGAERYLDPFPGLLPERDVGKRLNHLSSETELVEGHNSAGSDETRSRADEGGGIGLVDQDASADDRIVRLGVGEGLTRALPKVDVFELGRPSPFRRDSDGLSATIDPDDRSGGTDQLRGQHGNIARTAAQVEDPHAAADTRVPQRHSVIGRKIVAWCISLRISRSECPRMYF